MCLNNEDYLFVYSFIVQWSMSFNDLNFKYDDFDSK